MSKSVYVPKAAAVTTVAVAALALMTVIGLAVFITIRTKECPHLLPPTVLPTTASTPTEQPPEMRLPGNLIPESYNIYLHVRSNMTDFKKENLCFSGNSTVKFQCVNTTNTIYIHSKDLNVTLIGVTDEEGKEMATLQVHLMEDERDFVTIELVDSLNVDGLYYLSTEFTGECSYFEGLAADITETNASTPSFIVFSQLESTAARKVFPCFDEPAMKAVFNVTIIHKKGTVALSTMPQKEQLEMDIDDEEWLITEFYPTKKMATYSLAFIVLNFEYRQTNFGSYILKTWARPEVMAAGLVDYAHNITGNILEFLEEYCGIKYPLGKLDQVAVEKLRAGGLENWGLIEYSEMALTYKEGVNTLAAKLRTIMIVAHELAHQWFGNLVTMRWWNDLWLKEGFSSYVAYLALDSAEPGGNMKDLISLLETQSMLKSEAWHTKQKIATKEENIRSPSDISSLYGIMAYNKAPAVLRMIAEYLPDGVFQKGVQSYLKAYQYSSADQQDLWSHMQMAVDNGSLHLPIAEVMDTWTEQSGYPLITINTTSGEVSQEHFCLNKEREENLTWQVPIKVMKSGSGVTEADLLTVAGPVSKAVYQCNGNEWILANVNHTGYYRVNYNPENWEKLFQQLETDHQRIPPLSRAQLIDDAFFLARAKYVNFELALSSTKYLWKETEFVPWKTATEYLDNIIPMLDRTEAYGPLKAYIMKLVGPLYDHFENFTRHSTIPPSHTAQLNQINSVQLACAIEYPKCRKMATDLFDQWKKAPTKNPIHPNLRQTVYCSAIASGGEVEWDFAWEMLKASSSKSEKQMLIEALACTKHVWILNRYLLYALNSEIVEFFPVARYVARNVVGYYLAWNFVRSHWSDLLNTEGKDFLFYLINIISERFSTEFELQKIKEIRAQEPKQYAECCSLEEAIERTQTNIRWMEDNMQPVFQWLQMEVSPGKSGTFHP